MLPIIWRLILLVLLDYTKCPKYALRTTESQGYSECSSLIKVSTESNECSYVQLSHYLQLM